MVNFELKSRYDYEDLLRVVHILRSPGGCPWDQEQTHKSIRRDFLEEAYEAAEAIDTGDTALLREELGDVLLQVVFHADMESDAGNFTMEDVVDEVTKKMIFRHPHVFAQVQADTTEQVLVNWEQLKREEKDQKTAADTLDSVARSLPQLWRAEKIQKKAAKAGFDWADVSGALEKLEEETAELRRAAESGVDVEEELGDVLFAAAKIGQMSGVDPEDALHCACDKFDARFRQVEAAADKPLSEYAEEELLEMWTRSGEK